MTGIEPSAIAGVGAAAAKIAGKAVEVEPKDRDVLRQLAEKSGELEPASRAYAKRLAVKEQVLLKIWQPLGRLVGMSRDYFEFQFADEMADRLRDVPEEELVTPRGSVAGPAFQGLGFTVEEPELKAMYLNLLATASDKRVNEAAHPSFAEIIRQLSAEEARALNGVLAARSHPIVEVRLKSPGTDDDPVDGFRIIATNVMNWLEQTGTPESPVVRQAAAPERAMFVDNWIRLGLVNVDYMAHLTDESRYSWVDTAPIVMEAREKYDEDDQHLVTCQRGYLQVSDFGLAFHRAVIRPAQDPATNSGA